MRCIVVALAVALCLALVSSHPLPEDGLRSETLDRLVMAEADSEAALRSKRTIGILRQLFPEITQQIETKFNAIIAQVIRAVGPIIFRSLLARGGGAGGAGGTGGAVDTTSSGTSVTSKPVFGDEDDDEGPSDANNSRLSFSLPTFPPENEEAETVDLTSSTSGISSTAVAAKAGATTTLPPLTDNEITSTRRNL